MPIRYLLVLLLLVPGAAFAQDAVFTATPSALSTLAPEQVEALARLEAGPAVLGAELGEADPAVLAAGGAVRLALPSGGTLTLTPERLTARAAGGLSWYGLGQGAATTAHFVVRGDVVVGVVEHAGQSYALRPLAEGVHVLVRLDHSRALPEHEPPTPPARAPEGRLPELQQGDGQQAAASTAAGSPTIDIMAVYSSATRSAYGSASAAEAAIQLEVDVTNQAYANSDVDQRIAVVHMHETSTGESNSMRTDLEDLTFTNDGRFEEIHDLRDQYGADLVALFGNDYTDYCGIAWLNDPPAQSYAQAYGFSVTNTNFLFGCINGGYTFPHELGHNMGATHNTEVTSNPYFPYGHGLLSTAGDFRTIMSYNSSSCPGGVCSRIPNFSNPDVFYDGRATGDVSLRDVARVLDETAAAVAAFRAAVAPPSDGEATVVATLTGSSVIGRNGGPLAFDLAFSNTSGADFDGEYWVMATLPNGAPYGPVFGPTALSLLDGQTSLESLVATVPRGAPAGGYTVTAYVGQDYPDAFDSSSSFGFTKSASRPAADASSLTWVVENRAGGAPTETTMSAAQAAPAAVLTLEAFPSPFTRSVTIRYALPEADRVTLAVYDVLGREVAVLADGRAEAGTYEAAFEAAALPNGVYLVRLDAGERVATRRITLAR